MIRNIKMARIRYDLLGPADLYLEGSVILIVGSVHSYYLLTSSMSVWIRSYHTISTYRHRICREMETGTLRMSQICSVIRYCSLSKLPDTLSALGNH